jgi:hypothetical protein
MKKKTREKIVWVGVYIFGGFIALAMLTNVRDKVYGTNTAFWFNVAGWCLVPMFFVFCVFSLRKITGKSYKELLEK